MRARLPAIATTTATTTTTATATTAATTLAAASAAVVAAAATTAEVATTATTIATAATAVASAATATATVSAASAATESTTATATATLLALLGFVNAERPTVEGAAIHTLDRLCGFFGGSHGHKREPARATSLAIRDEVDITDGSELLERGTDAFCIGVEREIAYIQTSVHRLLETGPKTQIHPPHEGPSCSKAGFRTDS
jgi:hypothetical protein